MKSKDRRLPTCLTYLDGRPVNCDVCDAVIDQVKSHHFTHETDSSGCLVERLWIYWKCSNNHDFTHGYSNGPVDYKMGKTTWKMVDRTTQTGTCFIATAAYGTPMAPELDYLRWYRDAVLLKHTIGKVFVWTYYHTSPPIADFIATKESLRAAVRWLLNPIVSRCKAIKENQ
jgi:hypothetical protein